MALNSVYLSQSINVWKYPCIFLSGLNQRRQKAKPSCAMVKFSSPIQISCNYLFYLYFFISFYSKTSIQQVVSVWFTSIYIIIIISIYIFLLKCSGQDVMLAAWELATIQTVEHFYWFYKSINKLQTSYKCQQPRQMIIGVIQGRCSQKV